MTDSDATALPATMAPFSFPPVGADTMRLVAALMDDPNPIHLDASAAAAAGLGDRTVVQGPVTFGYLLEFAARSIGGLDGIRHASIRFLGNVFDGDRLTCCGSIDHAASPDARIALHCEANVGGRPVAAMWIESALPGRDELNTAPPNNVTNGNLEL